MKKLFSLIWSWRNPHRNSRRNFCHICYLHCKSLCLVANVCLYVSLSGTTKVIFCNVKTCFCRWRWSSSSLGIWFVAILDRSSSIFAENGSQCFFSFSPVTRTRLNTNGITRRRWGVVLMVYFPPLRQLRPTVTLLTMADTRYSEVWSCHFFDPPAA